jgi:hypothetical protein
MAGFEETREEIMKSILKQPVALLLALTGIGLTAQDGEGQRRRGGPDRDGAPVVERALRLGEEIGLSQDQRNRLESMRLALLEDRQAAAAQLMALRSEVRAGLREPEAMRQEMQALRESGAADREARRAQVEEVLTEEQRTQLRELGRDRGIRGRSFRGRGQRQGPWSGRSRGRRGPGS